MRKLSLRDLFALVTIVALALGWWVDHRRIEREKNELFSQLLPLMLADFRARQHANFQRIVEARDQR
jgi:hypothetical protein